MHEPFIDGCFLDAGITMRDEKRIAAFCRGAFGADDDLGVNRVVEFGYNDAQ